MIDKSKRRTLKALSVGAGTLTSAGLVGPAFAALEIPGNRVGSDKGDIEVTSRISALKNDIELVVKNSSSRPVAITNVAPSVARVARGEFDFSSLVKNGPLHIDAGASITLPLLHTPVSNGSVVASTMSVIEDSLKRSLTIAT